MVRHPDKNKTIQEITERNVHYFGGFLPHRNDVDVITMYK